MLKSGLDLTCVKSPTESYQKLGAFVSVWGELTPGNCVCIASIVYGGWQWVASEAAALLRLHPIREMWYLLSQITNTIVRMTKALQLSELWAWVRVVKLKQTVREQHVVFVTGNPEERKLIYIQNKTNGSCRNWKLVLTVPPVSLGDANSSLNTWRWRMSLATGSICCLNIPKPWLTKWKGRRATARSLLNGWKQNCRDFSVFLFSSNWSWWKSEDQYASLLVLSDLLSFTLQLQRTAVG